jgi:malate dehydrogenase (oxaloacetate-decarboxylating)
MEPTPNWYERYNASRIVTVRVRTTDRPGMLASVLSAIAKESCQLGDIRVVGVDGQHKIRDVQLFLDSLAHQDRVVDAIKKLDGIAVLGLTDEVLEIHRAGTIETRARVRIESLMDLRMVYTPGVASVCELIAHRPETAWEYTALGQKICIVSNGTAVLGLGDIGPLASLPVMEGKAAILARFVGVSAEPLLIDSKDPAEIIDIVAKASIGYGAIQLEDIAAPTCFLVERGLQARVDKPVFHDDQHGTATVCCAGLINSLARTSRKPKDVRAIMLGAGAAGTAIAKFLLEYGIGDVICCDSVGAIWEGRKEHMNAEKEELAKITNRDRVKGSLAEAIRGRNLFIGVSKPNAVHPDMVRTMAKDPIVFALANPISEIAVKDALAAGAAIALDGRSMNNALAYPGIFRGALDARAKRITKEMMLAASHALAASAPKDSLLPDMLDMTVHQRVTEAVRQAATSSERRPTP